MSDVSKALDAAADAVGSRDIDDDWGDIARAAVLAFLKAMPDGYWAPDDGSGIRHGLTWHPSALATAIEKEPT